MDAQQMINVLLGLVAFFGGWVMHSFKSQIRDNSEAISKTTDRLTEVELLVAGKYITRDEMLAQNLTLLNELRDIHKDIQTCMFRNRRKDDDNSDSCRV